MGRSEGKVEDSVHIIADKGCVEVQGRKPMLIPKIFTGCKVVETPDPVRLAFLFNDDVLGFYITLKHVPEGEVDVINEGLIMPVEKGEDGFKYVAIFLELGSVEEDEEEVGPVLKNLGIYARTTECDWGRPIKASNKFSLQRLKNYFDKLGHLAAKYNKLLLTEHAVAFLLDYFFYPAYALKDIERIPEKD